ncbi:MAG TPA: VWA domain-containing protein [Planctomycetaceae bacterium]|jgi:hypothetical protein|nr:VWA domain-containing protein [Planctomycetaceae bacterium]
MFPFRVLGRVLTALAFAVGSLTLLLGAAERKAPAKPASTEFRTAKRVFQQKFRSKQTADRVAAVRKLADVPGREAAELLWQSVLGDDSREVRRAACELVSGWEDQPGVSRTLLDLATRTTRKAGMDLRSCCVIRALAGTENGDLQNDVLGYLDEFLGTPRANQRMVHDLVDALGEQGSVESLRILTLFSRAKFFEKNFGFRRCVLQGVVRVPGDDTITFVIDLLPRLKGLVQYDVITYLIRATGENYRDDAAGWKAWWVAQQQKLSKRKDPPPVGNFGASGAFYGIPIGAKRVVFVLDISRSMEKGGRIDAAKRELSEVIQSLPPDVYFGIVAFHGLVHVWQQELMPANEGNRKRAIESVMGQETRGGTSSYDALEAAFALDPEAIYFVTDGQPVTGKIVDPKEIVASVADANRVRRISVHSIGIGTGDGGNIFSSFLRDLAEADWGEYRAVDH